MIIGIICSIQKLKNTFSLKKLLVTDWLIFTGKRISLCMYVYKYRVAKMWDMMANIPFPKIKKEATVRKPVEGFKKYLFPISYEWNTIN